MKSAFFARNLGAQEFRLEKIAGAHADAGGLVFIAGADAPAGGSYFLPGARAFPRLVQAFVVGHDDLGFVADFQPVRPHIQAPRHQGVHFLAEDLRVQHHAVADEAEGSGVQNAGRDKMQRVFLALDDDRVSGVVAPGEPHDHLGRGRQQIDNFALAFIAPLRADNNHI